MNRSPLTRFFLFLLIKFLPIVLVLGAGIGGGYYLITHKPQAHKGEQETPITRVRVMQAKAGTIPVHIEAEGTVMAAEAVELRPQVSGEIIDLSPQLVPGGFFSKGEKILEIDPRDYKFALQRSNAELERARYELELEEGNQVIAKQEWEMLGDEMQTSEAGRNLALRKPQLKFRKAALEGATSSVETAKLNLERTVIKAPFNAVVQQENVDPGQVINPQATIARIVGTDRFWVRALIPVDKLPFVDLPETTGEKGADAEIIYKTETFTVTKKGYVSQLLPDLQPNGRMARVIITVEDPFDLKKPGQERTPLLIESFLRVNIAANTLENMYQVPRIALREGDRIFIMDNENRLEVREVKIAWHLPDSIVIKKGLTDQDRVIVSEIPVPIEGMQLELEGKKSPDKKSSLADTEEKARNTAEAKRS